MGLATSAMLLELKSEYGDENVTFNKGTYMIGIDGIESEMFAVLDPQYEGWKLIPVASSSGKMIIPLEVKTYFSNLLRNKLKEEIYTSSTEFLKVIDAKGLKMTLNEDNILNQRNSCLLLPDIVLLLPQ